MGPSQTLCVALKLSVASIGHFQQLVAPVGHYWSFFNPKQPHKASLLLTTNVYLAEFNKERPGGQVASIYRYYCSPNR